MRYTLFENRRDELLLIARLFLVILFLLFGWSKLTGFSSTIAFMAAENAPLPTVAAVIAVVMELLLGLAIASQFWHTGLVDAGRMRPLIMSSNAYRFSICDTRGRGHRVGAS